MKLLPRTDVGMEALVRQGLVVEAEQGTACAWAYLTGRGVPAAVILRVLSTPRNRRDGDRFALDDVSKAPVSMVRMRTPRFAH